ncbi:hypothetical protein TEA_009473 [Camellia sinensis var. sinensis]|uniref:Dirigent protein n=1 Tax=Camellia sinensis var. sinensis TaxID=542762 RepID=A0A4S4D0A6_CAMSN|nr:hypothetical protein TEA_009473 [Camellia sinensis var. sinensis]
MMRKLGTIVVLCSMAIAMPVFCSIAEDPKEVEQWFHDFTTKADQKVTKLHFYFQDLRDITTTIDMRLIMAIDIVFTDGTYNRSTLTVLGSNPVTQTKRELPVIGGTGVFRLARGVALLNTYFLNAALGNAIVEYTVIVQHY